jgi:hypothetical protein
MKKLFLAVIVSFSTLVLGACAASSTSPIGVNCNYSQGKPLWELPVDCQGR